MKFNRVTALLLSLTLAFSLAACGQGASSASSASSSSAASSAAAETKTEEQLLAEENEILSANDALWEKVFASMDKNVTETTISANYGDFLLSAVEKAKDQFSDEEYKTLTADAEKIRAIEEQIAALAPADEASSGAAAQGTAFPKFEGSDLEGNPVDNSLFAGISFAERLREGGEKVRELVVAVDVRTVFLHGILYFQDAFLWISSEQIFPLKNHTCLIPLVIFVYSQKIFIFTHKL